MGEQILPIIKFLNEIEKSGKYTVFYSYSGHCKMFNITLYEGKWKETKEPIFNKYYYLEDGGEIATEEYIETDIEGIINNIKLLTE